METLKRSANAHLKQPEFDFEFWDARAAAARRLQYAATRLEERQLGHPSMPMVCRYWLLNACVAGDRCMYTHVYNDSAIEQCEYMEDGCSTAKGCHFRHYLLPGERRVVRQADPMRANPMRDL